MNASEFVAKWRGIELTERAASQSHFLDLCSLLDEPSPTDVDPRGASYCFEKGATKVGGGDGWADVWKRGHFGWEYKGRRKNLEEAHKQLQRYAPALENPPLLIVSDMARFVIHTNWTNSVAATHELHLDELIDPDRRKLLKWAFSDPERLRPSKTRQGLTEEAARSFVTLAEELRGDGHDPLKVAHFINRLVFCMFAEDVDLLPNAMFSRLLQAGAASPGDWQSRASEFFSKMRTGGWLGLEHVPYFNGGLFDDDDALPLSRDQILLVKSAAELDWADIDASIFGTLFERGLDPDKRSQLGAHYTDRDKIMHIVEPVIVRPLTAEWERRKRDIEAALVKAQEARRPAERTRAQNEAHAHYRNYLDRLGSFRALDPACGSGNFLYLALHALKDLELRANIEAGQLGLQLEALTYVGPENVLGLELNAYAAELARVTVWIGEIQWTRNRGMGVSQNPVLRPLSTIQNRDAVLNPDGSPTKWPRADVIIGNPPFLGGKRLRDGLGDEYVDRLFGAYRGRVPAEADLVTYWVAKAWDAVCEGETERVGLVTTNSVRAGANRRVLEEIATADAFQEVWPDEPWVVEGAAVRVSMLGFGRGFTDRRVNGVAAHQINADLTTAQIDLTKAKRLRENAGVAFMGDTKGGSFDVSGAVAREWLRRPLNPNGRPNSDVVRPWRNAMDLSRRPADKWIVDFGTTMGAEEAALYEAPFAHVKAHVEPERASNKREAYRRYWWRHVEARPGMRAALKGLQRYLATPRVAKHRLFVWLDRTILPDSRIFAFANDQDWFFGLMQSRAHELWSLRTCSWHGVGNDPTYNVENCFETFPFPDDISTGANAQPIAAAAAELHRLREAWLNPSDLVRVESEVVDGFASRLIPVDEEAERLLKARTLTNLYNDRPAWLDNAHRRLDAAVAAAYGWEADIKDDALLERLFALNQERAAAS